MELNRCTRTRRRIADVKWKRRRRRREWWMTKLGGIQTTGARPEA